MCFGAVSGRRSASHRFERIDHAWGKLWSRSTPRGQKARSAPLAGALSFLARRDAHDFDGVADTSAPLLSPLGPRGVFQFFPQTISIGNMHTLAVFKDR
jgi:hypothetical protein